MITSFTLYLTYDFLLSNLEKFTTRKKIKYKHKIVNIFGDLKSKDCIFWEPKQIYSSQSLGCMTPPPYGQQCTIKKKNSIKGCLLAKEKCNSLTCPSQEFFKTAPAVKSEICQLRTIKFSEFRGRNVEKNHGMCKPNGCTNIFFNFTILELEKEPKEFEKIILTNEKIAEYFELEDNCSYEFGIRNCYRINLE